MAPTPTPTKIIQRIIYRNVGNAEEGGLDLLKEEVSEVM